MHQTEKWDESYKTLWAETWSYFDGNLQCIFDACTAKVTLQTQKLKTWNFEVKNVYLSVEICGLEKNVHLRKSGTYGTHEK